MLIHNSNRNISNRSSIESNVVLNSITFPHVTSQEQVKKDFILGGVEDLYLSMPPSVMSVYAFLLVESQRSRDGVVRYYQGVIAKYKGMTRETCNRAIGWLRLEKIISTDGSHAKVLRIHIDALHNSKKYREVFSEVFDQMEMLRGLREDGRKKSEFIGVGTSRSLTGELICAITPPLTKPDTKAVIGPRTQLDININKNINNSLSVSGIKVNHAYTCAREEAGKTEQTDQTVFKKNGEEIKSGNSIKGEEIAPISKAVVEMTEDQIKINTLLDEFNSEFGSLDKSKFTSLFHLSFEEFESAAKYTRKKCLEGSASSPYGLLLYVLKNPDKQKAIVIGDKTIRKGSKINRPATIDQQQWVGYLNLDQALEEWQYLNSIELVDGGESERYELLRASILRRCCDRSHEKLWEYEWFGFLESEVVEFMKEQAVRLAEYVSKQ